MSRASSPPGNRRPTFAGPSSGLRGRKKPCGPASGLLGEAGGWLGRGDVLAPHVLLFGVHREQPELLARAVALDVDRVPYTTTRSTVKSFSGFSTWQSRRASDTLARGGGQLDFCWGAGGGGVERRREEQQGEGGSREHESWRGHRLARHCGIADRGRGAREPHSLAAPLPCRLDSPESESAAGRVSSCLSPLLPESSAA